MGIKFRYDLLEKYTPKDVLDKIIHFESVSEMWEHVVKTYPNNGAISGKVEKTFKEIDDDIAHFRAYLSEQGVNKGDIVGIYSQNSYEFVKAYLASVTIGACAVLMPQQMKTEVIAQLSQKYDLKAVLFNPDFEERFVDFVPLNKNTKLINISETSGNIKQAEIVKGSDPCCILFTGGTTGKSKGAMLSNKAIMTGTINGLYGYECVFEQRYLIVLPFTHVFGLVRNLMTSLYSGSNIFIVSNNKDMFKNIAKFKPTIMVMVPALAEMCLNLSKMLHINMLGKSLKVIICGAAQVPPFLIQEYLKMGIRMLPGYGLTESANLVSGNPDIEHKPDSVGLCYPGQDLKIVDGELLIKGDNVMIGYYKSVENATAFDKDGYFKTGDLVRFDEDGFLYIVGRTKEVIVLPSGEKISPAEIENKVGEISIVQASLLYLNKENILTLQIFPRKVEIKKNHVKNVEETIKTEIEKLNNSLETYERIQKVIIRKEDFKRTPAMKILRGKANEDYEA